MVDILSFISDKLTGAGIPYEYEEWTQAVTYPYFVGSYTETDYRYEDDCTTGTFTIDGWARESKLSLIEVVDTLKEMFGDLQEVVNDEVTFFIRYGGSQTVPSGEEGLFHVTVTLYASSWNT